MVTRCAQMAFALPMLIEPKYGWNGFATLAHMRHFFTVATCSIAGSNQPCDDPTVPTSERGEIEMELLFNCEPLGKCCVTALRL